MLFLVNPMSLLLCLSCSIGTLIEIIIKVILITAYFISQATNYSYVWSLMVFLHE